jgi:DNA-binding CsgD family transcriptional regulator
MAVAQEKCVITGCRRSAWARTLFCFMHLFDHLQRSLTDDERKRLRHTVATMLTTLDYREREIFKLRTALGDGFYYTLEEIAHIFGISSAQARQIEGRAFRKLTQPECISKLTGFLRLFTFGFPEESVIEVVTYSERELAEYVARHPHAIHNLSSREFEKIVAECLRAFGYQVELTPKTRDGGFDILAFTSDTLGVTTKYIVECKRFAADRPVRVELVRSLYGVKQRVRADHALLATTSYFTKDAVKFCSAPEVWNLHLKDYEAIHRWLRRYAKLLSQGRAAACATAGSQEYETF